jgi:pimeloyl-ACP methyl ester carboxylesterase
MIQKLVLTARTEGVSAAMEKVWLPHPIFDGLRKQREKFAELEETVRGFQGAEYREDAAGGARPPTDLASRLGEIKTPALVVVGEDDIPDFRLIADLMAANIAGARKAILPGCGHVPPMEDPAAFNGVLLEFLATNSPRIANE